MNTMDLLQWRSNSILGKIIRWRTGGYFNHTGVVIRFQDFEQREPRRWTVHATEHGLTLNYLSRELESYDGEVWWYRVKPGLKEQSIDAGCWMLEQVGVPYDFEGLFKNLFGKVIADVNRMFCSEAVFIGWQFVAIKYGLGTLSHLINIVKAPVPDEMTRVLSPVYTEGIRIY